MNIAIDSRPLLIEYAGVARYTYQLICALLEEKSEHNFYLYGLNGYRNYVLIPSGAGMDEIERIVSLNKQFQVPFPFRKITRFGLGQVDRIKGLNIQVFLWSNFLGKFSERYKSIITIHDMAHYYYPQYTVPGPDRDLPKYLMRNARKADLIICVSENTKKDVVNLLSIPEEKVWVTYNGVGEEFRPVNDETAISAFRERYKLPEHYILFVGTREPRKNLARLAQAYHMLYSRYKIEEYLVIAGGKGWKNELLYETIKRLNLNDRVIFTGYIPNDDLPLLYNSAKVFAYPSLYEGFGIPVVEAMACGVPVVTSNVSSLPEVAGDAALLVSPEDTEAIASAIYRILEDEKLHDKLRVSGISRAKQFNWKSCADKTLEAFSYVMRC